MITAYHRPESLEKALELLARPGTFALGGGTYLSRQGMESFEVVDLQALGLSEIKNKGTYLELGATVTIQQLMDDQNCTPALRSALKLEAPLNVRNAATVVGTLVVADGRSPAAVAMLTLDAKFTLQPGDQEILLGEYLPLRQQVPNRKLITRITVSRQAQFAFESIGRTPMDRPIVCVGLARWPSGRARLAVGGTGNAPILAMDGPELDGLEAAARNAFHDTSDEWGSAEYRAEVAGKLAARCKSALGNV